MTMQQARLLTFDQPLQDIDILFVLNPKETFTRGEIAKRLGRAKSPTLIARLNRMASEGLFEVQYYRLPNGVDMWTYTPTQKGVDAIYNARAIKETDAAFALGS